MADEEAAEPAKIERHANSQESITDVKSEILASEKKTARYTFREADQEISKILRKTRDTLKALELLDTKVGAGSARAATRRISEKELRIQTRHIERIASDESNKEAGQVLAPDVLIQKIMVCRTTLTTVNEWLESAESEQKQLVREQEKTTRLKEVIEKKRDARKASLLKKIFRPKGDERLDEAEAAAEKHEQEAQVTKRTLDDEIMYVRISRPQVERALAFFQGKLMESILKDVADHYEKVKEQFISPEMKAEYNEDIINRDIIPKIEAIEKEKEVKISDSDKAGIIDGIRNGLRIGFFIDGQSDDATREAEKNRNFFIGLCNKYPNIGYQLESVADFMGIRNQGVPDANYDVMFRLIFENIISRKLHLVVDELKKDMSQEQIAVISSAESRILDNGSSGSGRYAWKLGDGKYNLDTIPINYITDSSGAFVRWQVSRNNPFVKENLGQDILETEKTLVTILYDKALSPGGRESWPGTHASSIMRALNNPSALPLLVNHIMNAGVGHTTACVVYAIEDLMKSANPQEKQDVLSKMPEMHRRLLLSFENPRSGISRFSRQDPYVVCHFFAMGPRTIMREEIVKLLDATEKFDEAKIREYFFGGEEAENEPWVMQELLSNREKTENLIIQSRLGTWGQTADKLLAALVNPRNGASDAFPKRIVAEGLHIDDRKILAVIESIMGSKAFVKSGFERTRFTNGLLLLNAKQDQGALDLRTILAAYRGTKDDPQRVRRIFQLLGSLENLGSYGLTVPGPEVVLGLEQNLAKLRSQLETAAAKDERKKITSAIRGVELELQNVTGLKGIEDALIDRLAAEGCRKLDLPEQYQGRIRENLEELMSNGILEIIPTLAATYEHRNLPGVKKLLSEITMHIVDGDFKTWRYTHEQSAGLLAGLSAEESGKWQENLPAVKLEVGASADGAERLRAQIDAVKEHFANAMAHILEVKPDFDFSEAEIGRLEKSIESLTQRIISAEDDTTRKYLRKEKSDLQNRLLIVRGIRSIDSIDPAKFSPQEIIARANEVRSKIEALGMQMAALDLEQVSKTFTVGDIKEVVAFESDDPLTLLRVGVEPVESCQSWRQGGHNQCLLAYVADSNKKLINVADGEGRVIARSVIKLTHQKIDEEKAEQQRTILVEPTYALVHDASVFRVFARVLLQKAQQIDSAITFGGAKGEAALQSGSRGSSAILNNETLMGVFTEEARAAGFKVRNREVSIYIPQSKNAYEYSDTLGGDITSFNRYVRKEITVFER